jgi:hypothetical protein
MDARSVMSRMSQVSRASASPSMLSPEY